MTRSFNIVYSIYLGNDAHSTAINFTATAGKQDQLEHDIVGFQIPVDEAL